MVVIDIVKVIVPAALAFCIGIGTTPLLTHYLYKHQAWKKKAGKGVGYGGGATPIFDALHKEKDTGTPRLGGVVIWGSVFLTISGIWFLNFFFDGALFNKLEFLSRSQTWLPFVALMVGALVGFIDDLLVIRGTGSHFAGGLPLMHRLLVAGAVALFAAWWFYTKLDISSIHIPFDGPLELGIFFIPFFVLVAIAIYASGVIDGIDGLSGGVFASIFTAYAGIAFYQQQIDLAAFCATVVGGILAFLWFNIPPARFYMTETGIMGLTMALTVVAFMTDTLGEGSGVLVLPIIGFLLVITVASNIIQVISKKLYGKKVFRVAPIHHHFEAIGWPGYKVTMRYWILSIIFGIVGVIIALVG
ncbi:hypothetical protein A3D62_00500 [Candidatus Kaiserbacteria bacterium RIFCSPHIGHO2_02_FULL_49_11]|uniref:Phospho-N-acetylmuramoyl-pentapeptide-transferase n=1 Tax=Candidatus Kaiserbacteria bacterium RIFCSPHIGHO2_02_FULL_49_11 TaxID=1798489 RepID=A0A1F6CZ20_9BACT|nr:MAG: hypothetical protein A3D62_00500 [Candidatus Kaiserbacteria bacterium RIFCSPHIGHO2_02_FULL_49_11]